MIRWRPVLAAAAVLVGVAAAHLVDGLAEVSEQHEHVEAVAHGHAWSPLPWIATALLVIGVLALTRRLPIRLNSLLAALPFIAFGVQETTERIAGAEALPFQSNSLKHIALGLLLQIPVALFVYLLVRVAVAVVRRLVGVFARPASDARATPTRFCERRGFAPKISSLARGSPTRGPPLLVSS